jgi:xylulokinase
VRWAFEALERSAGLVPAFINIGGGGARSDVWCQIRADALGRPLKRAATPEIAALGAAMLAGVGTGVLSSISEAARRLVHFDRSFAPNLALRGYYADKFGHYRELYQALAPINRAYS